MEKLRLRITLGYVSAIKSQPPGLIAIATFGKLWYHFGMTRRTPLVSDQFYHVFNKSLEGKPIFINKRDCSIVLQMVEYYKIAQSEKPSFSKFRKLSSRLREKFFEKVKREKDFLVEILAFCLMPNHFHFLLKQLKEDGISRFIGNLQNSFTRFLNIKQRRKGHILIGPFRSVLIETEPQLIHISRYIHLNPYTSFVVKTLEGVITYPWSSFSEYLDPKNEKITETDYILSHFKNRSDYQNFVLERADYQRSLEKIKHLLLE